MQKIYNIAISLTFFIFFISCTSGKKERDATVTEEKIKLEKLKADKSKLDIDIKKLEDHLLIIDSASANAQKPKLVAVLQLKPAEFNHFIELQGRIDANNISYIAPHGSPGLVKAIYVKKGDHVRKGQLLLKLDNEVARQNVVAIRQNMGGVRSQLALAQSVYNRQKNLWEQNIGTEVQLLQSKTNVETLESQLRAMQENVKSAQALLDLSNIYSNVDGIADDVNVRVGESFTGLTGQGIPQIKIVNNQSLKVTANIPENYLNSVKMGTDVIVSIPDINQSVNTKVTFLGSSIDISNRGFVVEAKLPSNSMFKPNQVAIVKIKDYQSNSALSVPVAVLQNDDKGKFIMVADKENGKLYARKRVVTIGQINGDMLEIRSGLKAGDSIIAEGFQSLYDGQLIII